MPTEETVNTTKVVKDMTLESEEYGNVYTMKFENCTFNNCMFNQTGKPEEDDPPGTGD